MRVYIYEALALVLSGFLLGTVIGFLIALSISYQFNLFFELPVIFDFPKGLFILLISMSLLAAVFGSKHATAQLGRKAISAVLKGQL